MRDDFTPKGQVLLRHPLTFRRRRRFSHRFRLVLLLSIVSRPVRPHACNHNITTSSALGAPPPQCRHI
jgi:hypothetical protein